MENLNAEVASVTAPRRFRLRLFWEGILVGLIVGLVVSFFRAALELSEALLPRLYAALEASPILIPLWALVLVLLGLIIYKMIAAEPMAAGSGIPQVKGILMGEMKMRWHRVLAAKLASLILGIGAGLSLGRAGPSVQLGACVGEGVSRLLHRVRLEDHYLLTAGAGAGLAAAFNTPLTGVIFALEELTKSFSPFVLMAAISATVSATAVTQIFFGTAPVFHIGLVPEVGVGAHFLLFIALGAFVGTLGLAFNKAFVFSLDSFLGLPVPPAVKLMIPLLLTLPMGFFIPEVMGGGAALVDSLFLMDAALPLLCLLLAAKFVFTMLALGSGAPGGIFLPILVLGALSGAIFGKGAVALGLIAPSEAAVLIVYGMAAYYSAVARSPITATVLILEMTGSFSHLLALILVSMTACLAADLARSEPVYDLLLRRSLALRDKIRTLRSHRLMLELCVEEGSALAERALKDAPLPKGTLVVNLIRGGENLAPNADLILKPSDLLYVLADASQKARLESLASGGLGTA